MYTHNKLAGLKGASYNYTAAEKAVLICAGRDIRHIGRVIVLDGTAVLEDRWAL